MVYKECGRPDVLSCFSETAESVVGGVAANDGGKAALRWLQAHASADDDVCADAEAALARPDDPWRQRGERVARDRRG